MGQAVILVADGGATTLRMGVLTNPDAGQPRVERYVDVPGFQWTRDEDPVEQQCGRLVAAWDALGRPGPVDFVVFGLAGGAADPASRERLAARVAGRLAAPQVYATGDDVTTHLGALAGEPGVVVASGTGTLCLAVTPDGALHNIDGLGYLFGDLGSGFALGLAGIRAALAAVEQRGPATRLLVKLGERVGEPVREQVKRLYESPTVIAEIADFAAEVIAFAEDDPVARRLCADAGKDLASSVAAAVRQAFPDAGAASVPVSWSGRVLQSAPVVYGAFAETLAERCPEAMLRSPRGDSLAGAIRLAIGPRVPHLAAVARFTSVNDRLGRTEP